VFATLLDCKTWSSAIVVTRVTATTIARRGVQAGRAGATDGGATSLSSVAI
jgi:hypothetical protein